MKSYWKYGVVALLVTGLVIAYLLIPNRPPNPVLPVPNGYDDFLKAAQQVVSLEYRKYGESTDEELRDLVAQNQSALSLARAGFKHQSRVTTDYSLSPAVYAAQHMPVLANLKQVALAFRDEGELAEREGKTNEATRVYLDGIRFGQKVSRGGLLIDRLVGIACEGMNLGPLITLVPALDAQTCKELAGLLEQMDASREPVQATWDRERHWALRSGGILERIKNRALLLASRRQLETIRQKTAPKFAQVQFQERDLTLRLAAKAYQLEHGKPPEKPGDLVPGYLQAVPQEPATGQDMVFRP